MNVGVIVRILTYAQTCSRLDIIFVVRVLGRYQSNLRIDHCKVAKKVLRHLQGTKDHMLTYRRSGSLEVVSHSDLDYDGCVNSRKSTFGYIFLLAGGGISWKSGKEFIITTSTIGAEFVACFEATIVVAKLCLRA